MKPILGDCDTCTVSTRLPWLPGCRAAFTSTRPLFAIFAACHMEFERKRKFHYNEFAAVQLAKRLMSEEEDDDEDDRCGALSAISTVDETSTTLSVENAGISVSAGLTDDVCMVSDCM